MRSKKGKRPLDLSTPTLRKGKTEPWRTMVERMVDEFVVGPGIHRYQDRHADRYRFAIEQCRRALDPEVPLEALVIEHEGKRWYGTAGILRSIVEHQGLPWRSPMTAENIMAEVQRLLHQRLKSGRPGRGPADFDADDRKRMKRSGRLMASLLWQMDDRKPLGQRQTIRDKVLKAVHEALSDKATTDFAGPEMNGEATMVTAGAFRMVVDMYDYGDPVVAAAFLAIVEPAVDDELARPYPGDVLPPLPL